MDCGELDIFSFIHEVQMLSKSFWNSIIHTFKILLNASALQIRLPSMNDEDVKYYLQINPRKTKKNNSN